MRRIAMFIKPGWLALAAVVALFAYLCFAVLAPWQLNKNTFTTERNDRIQASLTADPVSASSLLSRGSVAPDDDWRRVTITGSYLPGTDVLVRLRTVDDTPSYEVLTTFRATDGTSVVVNRGYVLPVDGNRPPPIAPAPAGEVTLDGRVRQDETAAPGKNPVPASGTDLPQVYTITAAQVDGLTGVRTVDGFLQLSDGQPGGLGTIDLPQLDAGPYLSYGLQWLAFGLMAPLGLAYFVRAELRERRRTRADADGDAESGADGDAESGADGDAESDDRELRSDSAANARTFSSVTAEDLDDLDDDLAAHLTRSRTFGRRTSRPAAASSARLADRYGGER